MNMTTAYHAKYLANEITKQSCSSGIDKLSMSLFNACVHLNPHQVEAALFAFQSPLSKGVILADEVGLGKTIEAGLVLCQYWAERKRNVLIICPASLRKQWSLELYEKFNIPNIILEAKTYNQLLKDGYSNPFNQKDKVIIMSYNFANSKKDEIRLIKWNLAVVDEAHKLRNVHKKGNKTGKGIKFALEDTKKLLLTATPLQNSLMELYGLSTLISEHIFGDDKSFRAQYANSENDYEGLRERLKYFCKRTLRQDVLEYIKYTERKPITFPFETNKAEQELYIKLSKFLQREDTYSIPKSQRTLTTLVLRKLLASSSYAIVGTLETIKARLEKIKEDKISQNEQLKIFVDEDFDDLLDEEIDEIEELDEEQELDGFEEKTEEELPTKLKRIEAEIAELQEFIDLAKSVKTDSKTKHLIEAINAGFKTMDKDAKRKALIFTESRRTQDYLKEYLDANGFKGKVVLFNGTNTGPEASQIYKNWLEKNKDSGRISGSVTADKRNALIEHFRDEAEILIATESAAEGINLQFCSLLINYDLPWNPQRIEQRIGRCHRYGQKHDVVVINFLNSRNEADCRVYTLLEQKFNLFNGIFGSSDHVLGALESGVDFEKQILNIYQSCRSTEEINRAFDDLQKEMDEKIQTQMKKTKLSVLEHFDEDVHKRLKIKLDETKAKLSHLEKSFWMITKSTLKDYANFDDAHHCFYLTKKPFKDVSTGTYHLISKDRERENIIGNYLYRLSHPLGEYAIETAKSYNTEPAELVFDITNHPRKITLVQNLKGKSGYLVLNKLTIDSFDSADYLLFNAYCDDGTNLDQEICEKLFDVKAEFKQNIEIPTLVKEKLNKDANAHIDAKLNEFKKENDKYLLEESIRIGKWADDLIASSEKELADCKRQIKGLERQKLQVQNSSELLDIENQLSDLTKRRRKLQEKIFDVEDEIKEKRDSLIADLRKRKEEKTSTETLFMVRWKVV